MKSIWNGMLSFGFVNIPIKLYPTIHNTDLSFHYLHRTDQGRISNQRVCTTCGQSIDYDEVVRGYEYEKGKYITLSEDDFEKVSIESTKNMALLDFVDLNEIDPILFEKSYYLTAEENSEKLYVLLHEALTHADKVGVARFVLHGHPHLAVIKSHGRALILHTLHFSDEIEPLKEVNIPTPHMPISKRELEMAELLINNMSSRFEIERYRNTYREGLRELIDKKIEGEEIKEKPRPRQATLAADVLAKLEASIEKAEQRRQRA